MRRIVANSIVEISYRLTPLRKVYSHGPHVSSGLLCGGPADQESERAGSWVVVYRSSSDQAAAKAYGGFALRAVEAFGALFNQVHEQIGPTKAGYNCVSASKKPLHIAAASYLSARKISPVRLLFPPIARLPERSQSGAVSHALG